MAKKNKSKIISISVVVVLLLVSALITEKLFGNDDLLGSSRLDGKTSSNGEMLVEFIDVGQGDCTLITTSEDVILIDGGEVGEAQTVINYLKNKGISEIDCCIATHPHSDHIGSLTEIFKEFELKNIIMLEDAGHNTSTYEHLLLYLLENEVNTVSPQIGQTYTYGQLKIEILGPVEKYDDLNHMSIVAKVSFGSTSVMLTGDTEVVAEEDMLKLEGVDYSADILKIAHHGSDTSTSEEWLSAVNPQYAVISCGENNSYGHPHKKLLNRLDEFDIEYYRTDLEGDIIFKSDGKEITRVS